MPAGPGVSPAYARCVRVVLCEPQAAAAKAPDATTAVRRSACRMRPIVTLSDRRVKVSGSTPRSPPDPLAFDPGARLVDGLVDRATRRVDHVDTPARVVRAPVAPTLQVHLRLAARITSGLHRGSRAW